MSWKVHNTICGIHIRDERGVMVADIPARGNDTLEQMNANVIAAAPELYGALVTLARIRESIKEKKEPYMSSEEFEKIMFAALAKARGESGIF